MVVEKLRGQSSRRFRKRSLTPRSKLLSHGLPKVATRQRKKLNSDEEDSDFVLEELAPPKAPRNTMRKVTTNPADLRAPAYVRRSTTLTNDEPAKKAGVKSPKKWTIHLVGRRTSRFGDPEGFAGQDEIPPPPPKKKLMFDAMKSPPKTPTKENKVVAPTKTTKDIPAATKKKGPASSALSTEEVEDYNAPVLRNFRPTLQIHNDVHLVAEDMKKRKDAGLMKWRAVDPYAIRRRTVVDPRFHTKEQQDIYETVLFDKSPVVSDMRYESTVYEWATIIGAPKQEDQDVDAYSEAKKSSNSMANMYKTIPHKYLASHKMGSVYFLQEGILTTNTIVRHTLMPKSGDDKMIKVMDMIVDPIRRSAADQKRSCGYAPYIKMLINAKLDKHVYLVDRLHLPLQPEFEHNEVVMDDNDPNSTSVRMEAEAAEAEAARNRPPPVPQLITQAVKMKFLVSSIQGMEKNIQEILQSQKSLERVVETKFDDMDVKVTDLTTIVKNLQHEVDSVEIPCSHDEEDKDDDEEV
ncbi:hypothetical protein ZWY2020_025606 [Hordeum vulgare]|nr:hypothetical protein ZWY2020_025606 [Hordeum vulgare]